MTLPPQIELRARCSEAAESFGHNLRDADHRWLKESVSHPLSQDDARRPRRSDRIRDRLASSQITGRWRSWITTAPWTTPLRWRRLRLFDPVSAREHYDELLAWPLFTDERSRWDSRREFLDDLLSCRNEAVSRFLAFQCACLRARLFIFHCTEPLWPPKRSNHAMERTADRCTLHF